jgi:hypothetical protein
MVVFFSRSCKVSFFCEKKTILATFLISIEKFYPVLKEIKKTFGKKNCGFVDSEFGENMSRTC